MRVLTISDNVLCVGSESVSGKIGKFLKSPFTEYDDNTIETAIKLRTHVLSNFNGNETRIKLVLSGTVASPVA